MAIMMNEKLIGKWQITNDGVGLPELELQSGQF